MKISSIPLNIFRNKRIKFFSRIFNSRKSVKSVTLQNFFIFLLGVLDIKNVVLLISKRNTAEAIGAILQEPAVLAIPRAFIDPDAKMAIAAMPGRGGGFICKLRGHAGICVHGIVKFRRIPDVRAILRFSDIKDIMAIL